MNSVMLRIRKAEDGDARNIGACHYHCWQETYPGLISEEFLNSMDENKNMDRFEELFSKIGQFMYVILDDSHIVGFFDISPARDKYAPYEIQGLYLRKTYHGCGCGRAIMNYIRGKCGADPFYLWCLSTNPTCNYYTHMGGKEIARKKAAIGSQEYEEICFLFSDLTSEAETQD